MINYVNTVHWNVGNTSNLVVGAEEQRHHSQPSTEVILCPHIDPVLGLQAPGLPGSGSRLQSHHDCVQESLQYGSLEEGGYVCF